MTRPIPKRYLVAALRFTSRDAFSAGIRDHARGVWRGDEYRDDEAMTYERWAHVRRRDWSQERGTTGGREVSPRRPPRAPDP